MTAVCYLWARSTKMIAYDLQRVFCSHFAENLRQSFSGVMEFAFDQHIDDVVGHMITLYILTVGLPRLIILVLASVHFYLWPSLMTSCFLTRNISLLVHDSLIFCSSWVRLVQEKHTDMEGKDIVIPQDKLRLLYNARQRVKSLYEVDVGGFDNKTNRDSGSHWINLKGTSENIKKAQVNSSKGYVSFLVFLGIHFASHEPRVIFISAFLKLLFVPSKLRRSLLFLKTYTKVKHCRYFITINLVCWCWKLFYELL